MVAMWSASETWIVLYVVIVLSWRAMCHARSRLRRFTQCLNSRRSALGTVQRERARIAEFIPNERFHLLNRVLQRLVRRHEGAPRDVARLWVEFPQTCQPPPIHDRRTRQVH